MTVIEPAKTINVCYEADVCVVGGSCTGLFAAVRAARLGASVVIIEKQNCLGGVAANGLVNIWHSLHDTEGKKQVIAGLTEEVIERLESNSALKRGDRPSCSFMFNPNNLKFELDKLAAESKIKIYFHTYYSGISCDGDRITHIYIENKDGRSAVKAKFFIDCTGDGDLARDLGIESFTNSNIQPPSACFFLQGNDSGVNLSRLISEHGSEFGLADDWGWAVGVPFCDGITMRADNHVFGKLCSRADDLTESEIEGRFQMNAFLNLLRKYGRQDTVYNIVSSCSYIGIRDTVHYKTGYQANETDLLLGKRYDDAILNGTYNVDIHHDKDMGITFKFLDGSMHTIYGKYRKTEYGNWREDMGLTGEPATYYQVPFRVLTGMPFSNFLAAGRMLNADTGAFGALRVMVNLNQLGEAAGTAAYISIDENRSVNEIDGIRVNRMLINGGSAL